jgi:DNA-binding MarR family transcriptional regulator
MKEQPPYEFYEERRKYPRVVVDCPIDILFKDKELISTLYDVSPDGLQIRCNREMLMAIRPSGKTIKPDSAPKLDVEFSLMVGKNKRQITAVGEMYYFVLLPSAFEGDKDVALGVRFKKLKGNSAKYIDEFITDALTPVESRIRAFLDEPRTHSEIAEHLGLESHNVSSALIRLFDEGEIISIGSGKERKHMRLASVIQSLLHDTAELKARVSSLEKSKSKSKR